MRDQGEVTDSGQAIEAEGIVRRFGETQALAGVSITIRKGEFFSLLGPSGCGKTTLLRIVAGLDTPDAGTLKIGGKDAAGIPAHLRPVNTVFQSYALFPHLSVRDNIAFGLRMKKVAKTNIADRVDRIMEIVQISPLADRKPAQLSGGQKQRVALARALVNEPEVLLLDEPLGALDLKLRRELQIELAQLQRRLGITFILVTHDQEEALAMSDRIAVMNHGRIEQMGSAEELYERPRTRFAAGFLGLCNLLEGTAAEQGNGFTIVETVIGRVQIAGKFPGGKKITLAIRPEKITLRLTEGALEPNKFSAKVEDVVYSGAQTQLSLRSKDATLKVCVLNTENKNLKSGQCVVAHLPMEKILVLDD